jgi:hypothetical protein
MKLWIASLTAACALNSASAQWLPPESFQYSLLGALIGGAVGGHSHCGYYHWNGENAAIGAGVGLAAGTLIGEARRQQYYNTPYAYPTAYAPTPGYGYAPYAYYPPSAPAYTPAPYPPPGPVYASAPAPAAAPAPGYTPARPNYAVGGTLVGAASGALIGEGTSGHPGKGAAIGAAAGLVLGGLAEHGARKQEAAARYTTVHSQAPAPTQAPAPAVASDPPPATAASAAPTSVWQATPALHPPASNAPRVPDAPTF